MCICFENEWFFLPYWTILSTKIAYMAEYRCTIKVWTIRLKLIGVTTNSRPYGCWKFHEKLPLFSIGAEINSKRPPSFLGHDTVLRRRFQAILTCSIKSHFKFQYERFFKHFLWKCSAGISLSIYVTFEENQGNLDAKKTKLQYWFYSFS
jgi:hypothetical protein